ncbi:MAPEG family protein [Permianibacter sp. IMCC34836]|uniref:MAPEG family protein n=1 Tax=Permianibacter fluminis TaxID=2738515 RepID=UPI001556B286|nr:MAPEG family protein [Permianibacter fluminis]NQD35940.1 MAPEG family protein [Permianibacter fluminis]
MKTELFYLLLVLALTALLWLPYVLNRIVVWGLRDTVSYPAHPKPLAPWAQRLRAAHANAVENLVVFAPLVLLTQQLGVSSAMTALACMLYFWSRLLHVVAYTLALPWLRTLGFFGSFVGQLLLLWHCVSQLLA